MLILLARGFHKILTEVLDSQTSLMGLIPFENILVKEIRTYVWKGTGEREQGDWVC